MLTNEEVGTDVTVDVWIRVTDDNAVSIVDNLVVVLVDELHVACAIVGLIACDVLNGESVLGSCCTGGIDAVGLVTVEHADWIAHRCEDGGIIHVGGETLHAVRQLSDLVLIVSHAGSEFELEVLLVDELSGERCVEAFVLELTIVGPIVGETCHIGE